MAKGEAEGGAARLWGVSCTIHRGLQNCSIRCRASDQADYHVLRHHDPRVTQDENTLRLDAPENARPNNIIAVNNNNNTGARSLISRRIPEQILPIPTSPATATGTRGFCIRISRKQRVQYRSVLVPGPAFRITRYLGRKRVSTFRFSFLVHGR